MKKMILIAATTLTTMLAYSQTENKEEQAVRSIVSTLETGWNNKSGETFASVFADVHDYIVVNGMYFSDFTRQGNAFAHQGLFNGIYKNHEIKLKIDKLNFIRKDLVMINALGGGTEKGQPMPENPNIIMTILAEKKNDTWKIISFHNHNLETFSENVKLPMPANVMYASWYKK